MLKGHLTAGTPPDGGTPHDGFALGGSGALPVATGVLLTAPSAWAAAATGGSGAALPYVEVQAENAAANGSVIGPSYTPGPARRRRLLPQGGDAEGGGQVRHLDHSGGRELDRLPVQHPGRLGRVGLQRAAVPVRQRHQAE